MGRTLKILLSNACPDLVPEFRNFGEDVDRAFRETYHVSIDEIDASSERFYLRAIPRRDVRTTASLVRKLAERHRNLTILVSETGEQEDG